MIHYILQTIAFQLLFLLVYDLFLKKETFFNYNRWYLLLTSCLSFILPWVKISAIREQIPAAYVVELPAVIIGDVTTTELVSEHSIYTWGNLWILGVIVSGIFLMYKLLKLIKLQQAATKVSGAGYTIRMLPNTNIAFTFFTTIFLGDELSDSQKENVLLHEEAHVKEYHSIDLFYFEILRLLFWFNPLLFIYQKRIASLHEFIADRYVTQNKTPQEYYQNLLSEVFQTENISFINTFFNQSLIKNRIVMLQKSKSKQIFKLKYLLLVPIVGVMLLYSSCAQDVKAQDDTSTATKATENESEILQNIEALKESIAKKGNISKEEEDALKVLYVLTNPEGLDVKEFDEVPEKVKIPFGVIDQIPIYPGCEDLDKEASKKCFTTSITQFVIQEFNTKVAPPEVSGRQRIAVHFTIDNKGNVKDVLAKTKHAELKAEAERIANKLPKMTPGKHQGKVVGVQYELPIIFELK